MLTLEEGEWKTYRTSMYYFHNFLRMHNNSKVKIFKKVSEWDLCVLLKRIHSKTKRSGEHKQYTTEWHDGKKDRTKNENT